MNKDSRLRTICKTITWRVIGSTLTFLMVFSIFTNIGCQGVFAKSLLVAGIDFIFKTLVFYAHERAWQMLPNRLIKKFLNFVK